MRVDGALKLPEPGCRPDLARRLASHHLIPMHEPAFLQADGDQHRSPAILGKTLLDLARDDYADPRTLAESKLLMRMLLNHYLAGQALQSRRVFMELQEL